MSKLTIKKKREQLALREAKIMEEIDSVANVFQTNGKKILIISLISGTVMLGAYGLFSLIRKKPKKNTLEAKAKKIKKSFSVKQLLLEKAASTAVNYIGQELSKAMEKAKTKK